MKIVAFASIAVLSSLSVACGGRFTEIGDQTGDAGQNDGGGTDGGTSDGGSGDAGDSGEHDGGSSVCPASVPTAGAVCTRSGVFCEYGSDFDPACDVLATCAEGQWQIEKQTGQGCPTPDPGIGPGCPSTLSGVTQGDKCEPFGAVCSYPEGRCACTSLGGPTPLDAGAGTWHCAEGGRECPYPRPRIGTACAPSGTFCDYGGCFLQGGSTLSCENGVWQQTPTACPASAGGH